MNQPPAPEEVFFTWDDLKRLAHARKRELLWAFILSGFLAFAYCCLQKPKFLAQATLRHVSKIEEQTGSLKNALNFAGFSERDQGAAALIHSKKICRIVVEKLGLQAEIQETGLLSRLFSRCWKNLRAEVGAKIESGSAFSFKNVRYEGEEMLSLFIRFQEEDAFEVFDERKTSLGCGKIGVPFSWEEGVFCLEKASKTRSFSYFYPLKIHPWNEVVKSRLKRFRVVPLKDDKKVFNLTFEDSDRVLAARFINETMRAYQEYLKKENEERAHAELAYLEERQLELCHKLDRVLEEQAAYLKGNLGEEGFVGYKQELEMLELPKRTYTTKLFDLEFEEKRLEKKPSKEGAASVNPGSALHEKKLALNMEEAHQKASFLAREELEKVCAQIQETEHLLRCLKNREPLPASSLLSDPKSPMHIWVSGQGQDARDFSNYLEGHLQILSAKKKTLEENLSLRSSQIQELQGINLSSAQNFYVSYQNARDEIQNKVRQLVYVRDQIHLPDFELSSLGNLLQDSVGQAMVQKAADLSLKVRDQKNRSVKEIARFKEALETEKTFLLHRIDQTIELEKLKSRLIDEKITALQGVCLDLISKEKGLVEEKLKELSTKMDTLPEKWKKESRLHFEKELRMGIIEGISKIIESKNLHFKLFHVDARTIDEALPSLKPESPLIALFSCGAALLSAFSLFLFHVGKSITQGFPLSKEALAYYGFDACGSLSPYCHTVLKELSDKDLATLRNMAGFFKPGAKCVGLIGGKHPDFSFNLAALLSLQKKQVLLIHASFENSKTSKDAHGLWQYLEGVIPFPPVQKKQGYDFLPAGVANRYVPELLGRSSFSKLLRELDYDFILIYSTAEASSSEAGNLLNNLEAAIVAIKDERIPQLISYQKWDKPLAFVICG
jgi:hypothetical protein